MLDVRRDSISRHACSGGNFALSINDGSGSRTDATGLTLDRIFANVGTFTPDTQTCLSGAGTWTPNTGDGRNLVVLFKDETMSAWEPMPAEKINYAPFAIEAKQVGGFPADSLLRVASASGTPLVGLAPLSNTQYAALIRLADGTSTEYSRSNQLNGVTLPAMSAGQVLGWNGSAWVSTSAAPGANSVTITMIQGGAVTGTSLDPAISISTSGAITSTAASTRDFKIYAPAPSFSFVNLLADASMAGSYSLKWPLTQGSNGQVLTSDGAGKMNWTTPAASGSVITALTGDVTASGTGSVPATVASVGGVTAANVASGANLANAASSANTFNALVRRDNFGNFNAGQANLNSLSLHDGGDVTLAPAIATSTYTLTLPTTGGVTNQVLARNASAYGTTWIDLPWARNGADASYTTGRVGIGTASPSELLSVAGGSNVAASFESATSSPTGAILKFRKAQGSTAAPIAVNQNDALLTLQGYGYNGSMYPGLPSATMRFVASENWTSGANGSAISSSTTVNGTGSSPTERMRIDPSGNVGLGVTNPGDRLEIYFTDPNLQFGVKTKNISNTSSAKNGHLMSNNASEAGIFQGSLASGDNLTIFNGSLNGGLILSTSNFERVRIDKDGRVGIGTNAPAADLQVVGTTKLGNTGTPVSGLGACIANSTGTGTNVQSITCNGVQAGAAITCSPNGDPGTTWSAFYGSANSVKIRFATIPASGVSWVCSWVVPTI